MEDVVGWIMIFLIFGGMCVAIGLLPFLYLLHLWGLRRGVQYKAKIDYPDEPIIYITEE